jgi:hypothetical protein
MAWYRNRYFRTSIRQGNHVKTLYYGSSAFGLVGENLQRISRELRVLAREEARAHRERELQEFRDQRAKAKLVDQIVAIGLESLGFHRPGRNKWRRKRVNTNDRILSLPATLMDVKAIKRRMQEIWLLAVQGDGTEARVAELRELAKRDPSDFVSTVGGNLGKTAALVNLVAFFDNRGEAGRNLSATTRIQMEAIGKHLDDLRAELYGNDPTPSVRLAADAAVFAYSEVWTMELAGRPFGEKRKDSALYQRRRDWAFRRYLHALETVERIRSLSRPRRIMIETEV